MRNPLTLSAREGECYKCVCPNGNQGLSCMWQDSYAIRNRVTVGRRRRAMCHE